MLLKTLIIFFTIFFVWTFYKSKSKSSGQILNVYSFLATEFFLKVILSSLLVYLFSDKIIRYNPSLKALSISFLYLSCIWIAFSNTPNTFFLKNTYSFFLKKTKRINFFEINLKFYSKLFLIIGGILFLLLMYKGQGMSLWILEPRNAYQFYRKGAGGYYVFSQLFVYLSFISNLFSRKSFSAKRLIFTLIFYLFIFYFYGSKRSLLTLALTAIVYYSYYIKKLSFRKVFSLGFFGAFLFILMQLLYSKLNFINSFLYFSYFDNIVTFFDKFPDFQYMLGISNISNLWSLVPRSLYPNKPFVYGSAYITEFLYPGMAEQSHTIGILPWITYYLDFGYLGVIFGGLLTGVCLKYVQYIVSIKNSFFVFVVFINYGFSPILKHVPFFTFLSIIFLTIFYLRLRIR